MFSVYVNEKMMKNATSDASTPLKTDVLSGIANLFLISCGLNGAARYIHGRTVTEFMLIDGTFKSLFMAITRR